MPQEPKPGRESSPGRQWKSKRNTLSWSAGPAESMRDAITRLTDAGCGVLLSKTIDGSALVLGVYSGDARVKEYITEPGDILPCLAYLVETYG